MVRMIRPQLLELELGLLELGWLESTLVSIILTPASTGSNLNLGWLQLTYL